MQFMKNYLDYNMNKKRGDAQQYLRNKKQILEHLNNEQKNRIDLKIGATPILKLGNVKPIGIALEMKMRGIE